MNRLRNYACLTFALTFLACSGCSSKEKAKEPAPTPTAETAEASPQPSDNVTLSAVNESLKTGAIDDAAANLLKMREAGHEFTPNQAADYRKALDEAYTRALEAAEKGDPRAEAALKMIRAATAR